MFRVLDLFSGIGGFSLGLERTGGFKTAAFCEYEKFPQQVLAKHWPDVPIFPDVRTLKGSDIDGPVDVICGGYPCQPFSAAGQRRGKEDDRHLWPEFSRLVDELRPTWVIGENVAGHISMGLDDVLSDLEGQGYACRTFVIPACAVGASHRRDRVWTVAHASQLQRNGSGKNRQQGKRQISEFGKHGCEVAMADTERKRGRRRNPGGKNAANAWQSPEDKRGNRSGVGAWLPEPNVGRVANGVSRRVDRLKALGNAVVPQVVEMLGRAILEAEHDLQSRA